MAGETVAKETVTFNITQQRADLALTEFAEQADLTLIFPPELVGDVSANELIGTYTQEEGAEVLLAGTGLSPMFSNRVVLSIAVDTKSAHKEEEVRDNKNAGLGALIAAFLGVGAYAQEAPDSEIAEKELEKIVVTGSRIAHSALSSPTPVTIVTAADIALTGRTNIEEILGEIPALTGSSGLSINNAGDFVGSSFLNLRNLGGARTLVLINGRRHVGSNEFGSASVDTNSIPVGLISRVDVTTGGASAVYGADGVSGVVNFILNRDFEGLQFNLQGGQSDFSDSEDILASILAGHNFADGRGNVTFSYEFNRRNGIRAADRDFTSTNAQWFMNNPVEVAAGMDIPGEPAVILAGDIRDIFVAADGIIDPFQLFSGTFRGNDPLQFGNNVGSPGAGVPSGTIGGNGTEMWRIILWSLIPDVERSTVNTLARFDFSESTTGFVEAKYSTATADSVGQSTFTIISNAFADNPFLPPNVVAAAGLVNAGTPLGPPILYNRFDIDSGGRKFKRDTDTFRIVAGLEGDITDSLSYNFSINFGKTEIDRFTALRQEDRYFAAVDAVTDPSTGLPECRSTLDPAAFLSTPVDVLTPFDPSNGAVTFTPGLGSGCVPLNPFIDDPAANKAAYDWIYAFDSILGDLKQTVASGYINGDLDSWNLNLPGGAVAYVLGGEYRKEETSVDFPSLIETGPVFFTEAGQRDQSGKFDVWEVFTEVSLPIFKDRGPWMQELTLDTAFRFSDYSTVGSTNTWMVRTLWAPVDELRLRTTVSQAIRAPNINELFAPAQPQNFLPVDPCSVNNLQSGSTTREANCTAALADLGLQPDQNLPSTAVNFLGSIGGNSDLVEEMADTFTLGFVWKPSFATDLSLAVDYWKIEMSDGIILPAAQSIVNACYDAPSLDNPFCPLLGRAANGDLNDLNVQQINVADFTTTGIDFSMQYILALPRAGSIKFNLLGSFLDSLDVQATIDPVVDDERGETGTLLGNDAPEFAANFDMLWSIGRLGLQYGINYQDSLLRVENDTTRPPAELQQPFKTEELWNHDLRISYELFDNVQLFGGVQNLTDEKPAPGTFFRGAPISAIGRFYYAGLSLNLDSF